MRKTRKGQVQISETIAVIFIFFILVAFGIMFYYKYQAGALEEKQEEIFARGVIEKVNQVLFLPELACTKGEAELEGFCFDIIKVEAMQALQEKMQNEGNDYYFKMLGFGKVSITQVYPPPGENQEPWVIYEWQNPSQESSKPEKKVSPFVITLRDDRTGSASYKIGLLEVEVYR